MHIALAHEHVRRAVNLDLGAVLRVVENAVTDLYRAHVLPDRDNLGPREAAADRRGGRNYDAAARPAFAARPIGRDENAIVQQLDGQARVRFDVHAAKR